MELSKVSRKGLTNIPAKIRRAAKIEEGDLLAWEFSGESGVITVRAVKNPYRFLKGRLNDPNLTYERVEEIGDRLLLEAVKGDASNRT